MLCRRIFAVLLAIVLAIPVLTSFAQTPVPEGTLDEQELAGLQQSVLRIYARPGAFEGSGVIDLDNATPIADASEMPLLRFISITVYEFDSAENAAVAQERLSEGLAVLADGMFQSGTHELSTDSLPDLGEQATLVRVDHTDEGGRFWLEDVIVQQGDFVFVVVANASVFSMPGSEDVDTSLTTVDIATTMVNEGEKSDDDVALREDGTSTGGLWGFMPEADNPALQGMEADMDAVTFPRSEE